MSWKSSPDVWGLVGALAISLISGFVSISHRILKGHAPNLLWIVSEFVTAALAGTLTYYSYPHVEDSLPAWVTMPMAVAVMAHIGGRVIQETEKAILKRYAKLLDA